nr:MAG TPA: hypothetical protein [Caudoviricetes sp.]
MKKLTSFTHLITGEGNRIAFTYSEIDEEGNLKSQNNKGNFVAVDPELVTHINAINDYITRNKLEKE